MILKDQNTRDRPFSMNYRERGFHARSEYATQHTLRMGTLRVKEEETDKNNARE